MDEARGTAAEATVQITRVFDAPRELVWQAWTQPERVMRWWGPKGYTTPFCKMDVRPGGVSHYCMRSPEGQDYWSKGVYQEVVEPEKLVVIDTFSDSAGNVVPASYYGMEGDWPVEMLITAIFEEIDGQTKLTLQHSGIPPGEKEMCVEGWSESFDKLDEYLAEEQE